MVSSILWEAQRSKPEVLFDVTTLATRCKIGSTEDIIDVEQVLKYINSCKADDIKLKLMVILEYLFLWIVLVELIQNQRQKVDM